MKQPRANRRAMARTRMGSRPSASAHAVAWVVAAAAAILAIGGCTDAVAPDPVGTWGGDHVRLEIVNVQTSGVPGGGTVEFDCAHGSINAPVTADKSGRFEAPGVYVQEHGGPVFEGEISLARPALYAGEINGSRMTLTVTRTDSAWSIGPFTLERGKTGPVFKCL